MRQSPARLTRELPALLLLGAGLLLSDSAQSAALPFDPSQYPDPNALIDPKFVAAIVKTIGLGTDHRSYEPATALGSYSVIGLDFGVDITAAKLPKEFNDAIKLAGVKNFTLQVLPIPRLHLHKSIGKWLGVGVSYIGYQNYKIYGGDAKVTFFEPEEGPTFAFRLAYSTSRIGFVQTKTWNPQLVMSRRLVFADPYLGIGYQTSTGKIQIPISYGGYAAEINAAGSARSFIAYSGIQFTLPTIGLQLTLEGDYSAAGIHTLGTKVGFSF
ncbi:MAG: hypothetical protein H7222_17935 [Methylotenera sp.]|nr:hypothetical protein [Oligoflexia bacterium]